MLSLFFRNLFFTILQPSVVVGLIPYLMLNNGIKRYFDFPFTSLQYIGLMLFFLGFLVLLYCIVSFAIRGKGTLSPADPTKQLVVSGLYRFSRNPMYVGVIMMLIGESVFFHSYILFVYTVLVFTAFHLFIKFFEEPRLKKDFGEEYNKYSKKVSRWI